MRYRVTLSRLVIEDTDVIVDAENEIDAAAKAEAIARDKPVALDWQFRESYDQPDAVAAEPAAAITGISLKGAEYVAQRYDELKR